MGEIIHFTSRKQWDEMKQQRMLQVWEEYLRSEREKMKSYKQKESD